MAEISDAYMQEQLGRTREYAVVLLRASEQYGREGSDALTWEHGVTSRCAPMACCRSCAP